MKQIEKSILLGGRAVTYTLTRKKIKNLNLRVRADGTIAVSVPLRASDREVEAFVKSHSAFVLSALERFEKRRQNAPTPHTFTDGEQLCVFGETLDIRVLAGKKICGVCDGKTLFLTVKDTTDESQRRRAAEQWAAKYLSQTVLDICAHAERDFEFYKIPRPIVKFRRMTSRWGSCNPRQATLTFNYALIGAPIEAVEYVVYHEFAHLLYPNHSPAFYEQVSVFLPDWRARRAMLKAVPCQFL